MSQPLNNPIEIVKYVIDSFYVEENIVEMMQYLAENVVWIENESMAVCKGKEMLQSYFAGKKKRSLFDKIKESNLDVIWNQEPFLLISGSCRLRIPGIQHNKDGIQQMCSAFLEHSDTGYRILHMHISNLEKESYSIRSLLSFAQCDALTGIYNIRAARSWVEHWLENSQRNKGCSMFMIDVDNFKHINDAYGHMRGNEILVKVAKMLKKYTGQKGIVGRVGGDEFLIFLKTGVQMEVIEFAETILWESKKMKLKDTETITISMGVSVAKGTEFSYDELFCQSDQALYEAKGMGKDMYIIYSEEKKERDAW